MKSFFDDNTTSYIDEEFFDPTDDNFDDMVIAPEHFLKTNEEIFTDKYMQDFAAKMDAKIARERRMDKCISAGVILGCIFTVALFSLYAYWRYMC